MRWLPQLFLTLTFLFLASTAARAGETSFALPELTQAECRCFWQNNTCSVPLPEEKVKHIVDVVEANRPRGVDILRLKINAVWNGKVCRGKATW